MSTAAQNGTFPAGRQQAAGAAAELVLLSLLSAGVGMTPVGWLAGVIYTAAFCTVLSTGLRRARQRSLGPADRVTLARGVLIGGATALVADGAEPGASVAALVALSAAALVLDGYDGHVARSTGTVSPLGARFDMEVDAFLILVLSVHVAASLGLWVLAIGAMRYAFVAAAWAAPWLRSELPPSLARKAVAVAQGCVLVIAAAGIVPRPLMSAAVGLALTLLVWSFGRDVRWLRRARTRSRVPGAPLRQEPRTAHVPTRYIGG